MDIVYNGIHLSMCTVDQYVMQSVYDTSGTDYLFTLHHISGVALANGQAEVREIGGPPVSYKRDTSRYTPAPFMYLTTAPTTFSGVVGENFSTTDLNLTRHGDGAVHDRTTVPLGRRPPSGVYARKNSDLEYYIVEAAANPVPLTIQAIRHRLSVPRAPLFVFAGTGNPNTGELLLQSPAKGTQKCDAMNGPKPITVEPLQTSGEADSMLFRFTIETYINEASDNVKRTRSPLLSNRFKMLHNVDENQVTVIGVEGEAYFRTDAMYEDGISPDDYRLGLMLPVPFGFVRGNITVEGMAAANGVNYSFTDRQMPVHFPAGPYAGATQVQAIHTQTIITDTDLLLATAKYVEDTTARIIDNRLNMERIKRLQQEDKEQKG